jgi:hypothetical protein
MSKFSRRQVLGGGSAASTAKQQKQHPLNAGELMPMSALSAPVMPSSPRRCGLNRPAAR